MILWEEETRVFSRPEFADDNAPRMSLCRVCSAPYPAATDSARFVSERCDCCRRVAGRRRNGLLLRSVSAAAPDAAKGGDGGETAPG